MAYCINNKLFVRIYTTPPVPLRPRLLVANTASRAEPSGVGFCPERLHTAAADSVPSGLPSGVDIFQGHSGKPDHFPILNQVGVCSGCVWTPRYETWRKSQLVCDVFKN